MEWSFHSNQPIYTQLIEQLTLAILSGEYPTGGKLPAVRELAAEAGRQPRTPCSGRWPSSSRRGCSIPRRTSGRFITEDETVIQEARLNLARERAGGVPARDGAAGL